MAKGFGADKTHDYGYRKFSDESIDKKTRKSDTAGNHDFSKHQSILSHQKFGGASSATNQEDEDQDPEDTADDEADGFASDF